MPVEAPVIPSDLLSKVCPNCSYSLDGLPENTACPECGRPCDPSEVILYGWGIGTHENLANAKRSRVVWVFLASSVLFFFQFFQFIFITGWGLAAFLVLYLFPAAYLLFRRANPDHPGLIQVRLSSQGCVQYDTLAPPTPLDELLHSCFWVLPVAGMVWAIVYALIRHGTLERVQAAIVFVICAIVVVPVLRKCACFRRAIRQIREGSIVDLQEAFFERTPWPRIVRFTLKPAESSNYRLQIELMATITQFPVDAEIRCTAEQAGQLEELISHWLLKARHPAA